MTVLAPDIRDAFGVSDGAIVFISSASAAFFVLGAVPMGYLADRCRRAPIVGCRQPRVQRRRVPVGPSRQRLHAVLDALRGRASPRRTRCRCTARCSPTRTRSRCAGGSPPPPRWSAGSCRRSARSSSAGSPRSCSAGAGRSSSSGCRWPSFGVLAFRIPEPTAGAVGEADVLDEVIDDAEAAPISMEAAFARLKRIRTLRTVIVGFAALGFSLFTVPVLASLYLEDHFGADAFERGVVTSVAGFGGIAGPALPRAPLRRGLPPRPGTAAARRSELHRADGGRDPAPVPDAERSCCSPSSESCRACSPSPPSAW